MDKKILLGIVIGIGVLVVTMLVFVILDQSKKKKAKNNLVNETPDLMANDPMQNGNINLMAPDPVASIPVQMEAEKPMEFIEEQGLEKQLIDEVPISPVNQNNYSAPEPVIPTNNNFNAFEMSLPAADKTIKSDYSQNAISQKTQKFCPNCKTPNDVLNKYCTSCGYTFE